jgi:Ca-activated chloride channel family protein
MLVEQLDDMDRVSMVVYAGAAGVVLEPTSGAEHGALLAAVDKLEAGGSTNGAQGIERAYELADRSFIEGGANRVVLCTDGDFNVGVTSEGELVRLIEGEREKGVFLTVLGFGMGNLKDSTMESLADHGNGNYAYIDSREEAEKVLVTEADATLVTIAKDVKIQVELNPAVVEAYRLIGYDNRRLAAEDFNDDRKDAGEIGAGHSVTALYEIVPKGQAIDRPDVDPLRYQDGARLSPAAASGEIATVKLRYKQPDGESSELLEVPVIDDGAHLRSASNDLRFAAAVATFGLVMHESEHLGTASLDLARELAGNALGKDEGGHRAGFLRLVDRARELKPAQVAVTTR